MDNKDLSGKNENFCKKEFPFNLFHILKVHKNFIFQFAINFEKETSKMAFLGQVK